MIRAYPLFAGQTRLPESMAQAMGYRPMLHRDCAQPRIDPDSDWPRLASNRIGSERSKTVAKRLGSVRLGIISQLGSARLGSFLLDWVRLRADWHGAVRSSFRSARLDIARLS